MIVIIKDDCNYKEMLVIISENIPNRDVAPAYRKYSLTTKKIFFEFGDERPSCRYVGYKKI
jgi:hypothetical protein